MGRFTNDVARRGLKRAALMYDWIRPPTRGVVVLAYHRVGRHSSLSVDLPRWLFEEQMSRLADAGIAQTLDTALLALDTEPPPNDADPVVVTFDDGTADFGEQALPLLVKYRIPATLYIATQYVEEGRPFPNDGRPLDWPALADALSTGLVTIGSHSHSHVLFDRIDPKQGADELDRSVDLIGDRLGIRADHFAYPKALLASPLVEAEVRQRFVSAAVAGTRANPYLGTDPHRLARSPVQVQDGLRFFEAKLAGGLSLEDSVRRLSLQRRYAAAVR